MVSARWGRARIAIFVGTVGVALAVFCVATRWGIGLSPDSIKYIRYARTLEGLEPPPLPGVKRDFLTHYPPLYPLVLAAFNHLSRNMFEICRVLQGLLLALTLSLVGFVAGRLSTRPFLASTLLMVSCLAVRPALQIYLWSWSEPLFVLLMLICIWFLAEQDLRPGTIWIASLAAALAVGTRYAGVSLVPAGCLALWCRRGKRVRPIAVFASLPVAAFCLILWHNYASAGKTTDREFGLNGTFPTRLDEAARTVAEWVCPIVLSKGQMLGIGIGVIAVACLAYGWGIRQCVRRASAGRPSDDRCGRWIIVSTFVAIFYFLTIVASILLYDPLTPLDDRILSPIAFVLLINAHLMLSRSDLLKGAVYPIGAGVGITLTCVPTVMLVSAAARSGLGFQNVWWRDSETMRVVKEFPQNIFVYSNEPDAVYAQTGRTASAIAASGISGDSSSLSKQTTDQRMKIASRGVLIYFARRNSAHSERYTESLSQIEHALNVHVTRRYRDGAVLRAEPSATTQTSASP